MRCLYHAPFSQTLDRLEDELGPAVALRPIRRGGRLIAAFGRWHHDGAQIDLSGTRSTQLVLKISSGQLPYHDEQGLIGRPLTIEDMFAPNLLDT